MVILCFSLEFDLMDLIGEDRKWMVGRKLMQVNDTLTSEDAGLLSSKNCTEPGKMTAVPLGSSCLFLWVWLRMSQMLYFVVVVVVNSSSYLRSLEEYPGQVSKKHKGEIP